MLDQYSNNPFKIDAPAIKRVPFVFNSPHSGRVYTQQFLSSTKLNHQAIRKSEDFMVDELFACAVPIGAPILKANFPRAFLDVNREPYELDPAMYNGKLPDFVNTSSVRVASGLGTIAKIVSDTEEIYREKMQVEEALHRVDTLYKPYHAALRNLLAQSVIQFGHAVLIDCHSMPSHQGRSARQPVRPALAGKADFVLGNRFGTSCAPELTHLAYEFLAELGYNVVVNKPYAGGFITEHYGRPQSGLHALQIEINRALYMDELRIEKSSNFASFASDIARFVSKLVSIPEYCLKGDMPLAAE